MNVSLRFLAPAVSALALACFPAATLADSGMEDSTSTSPVQTTPGIDTPLEASCQLDSISSRSPVVDAIAVPTETRVRTISVGVTAHDDGQLVGIRLANEDGWWKGWQSWDGSSVVQHELSAGPFYKGVYVQVCDSDGMVSTPRYQHPILVNEGDQDHDGDDSNDGTDEDECLVTQADPQCDDDAVVPPDPCATAEKDEKSCGGIVTPLVCPNPGIAQNGGAGNQVIVGGPGADHLQGGGGNDIVRGRRCGDVVRGGNGNDKVNGGKGHDAVNGGKGNDVVNGNRGQDVVNGGMGNDVAKGGRGNDKVNGGAGNDVVKGGRGNDVVDGGKGNDIVKGGQGKDKLHGGAGNDVIHAGKGGKDVINCGKGKDVVYAGKGDKVAKNCEKVIRV